MTESTQDPHDRLIDTHDDVIKCWEFEATLQLRTPLAVLEHHGERVALGQPKPQYGPAWAGCWVPVTKTWAELGIRGARDRSPTAPVLVASQVGLVDQAKMVAFLKSYRAIVESLASTADRITSLQQLVSGAQFADVAGAFGPNVDDSWAADALEGAFGISTRIARALIAAGLHDIAAVNTAADDVLRTVPGVGRKTIERIRAGAQVAGDED